MPTILLATHNPGKLREIRQIAGRPRDWEWIGLDAFPDIPEAIEDGATFSANARKKALHYADASGLLTLADDSGLEVDALGGSPGVHSARYAGAPKDDQRNNAKLIDALHGVPAEQRTARFRCAMAFARPGEVMCETDGCVEGRIVDSPRGANGFGYDPHFWVDECGCTTAELAPADKNAISHRGKALAAILPRIVEFSL
jgi:XTP/dITP diphosphohydrolase